LLGDRRAAAQVTADLLAEGWEPPDVVSGLLVPVQLRVGELWAAGRCSVGHEHTVTAVTEAMLASLTVGFEPEGRTGHLVLVCAVGEWHGLPARMAAELLMLRGWQVTFLGPSLPPDHLARYLSEVEADAVGVSCTLGSNLVGAARSIDAARAAGFSVIAGGAAFGSDARRARAIGADGWVGDLERFDLDAVLAAEPAGATSPDLERWTALERSGEAVVNAALGQLVDTLGSLPSGSAQWFEHTLDDLEATLRFTLASLVTGDRTVLEDYADWLDRTLIAHGDGACAARAGFAALAGATEAAFPEAAEVLLAAAETTWGGATPHG
jgi:methanogenic corrinoid protein MtbC1